MSESTKEFPLKTSRIPDQKLVDRNSHVVSRLLKTVVRLANGRYGYVFTELSSLGYTKQFLCNICKSKIYGLGLFVKHSTHPTHTSNLLLGNFMEQSFTNIVDTPPDDDEEEEAKKDTPCYKDKKHKIVRGVPVPEQKESEQECQIQTTFDAYTAGPLIGLEYIVELVNKDRREPRYICLLCEKKGDPRSVLVHVTCHNHYLKYINCFFPSVGNKLNMMPKATSQKMLCTATMKVAEAIEQHYGRLKPTSAHEDSFSVKKYEILQKVDDQDHFRETPSVNFLELITAEKMKQYHLQQVSKESPIPQQNADGVKNANQLKIDSGIVRKKGMSQKNEREMNTLMRESDENFKNMTMKQGKDDEEPKKLTISLKKPERAIPGIKQTEVQNPAMSQLKDLPAPISEEIQPVEEPGETIVLDDDIDDDDDVIILLDDEDMELDSLSSVSGGSLKSESKARSGRRRSNDRFGRSRDNMRDRLRTERGRNSLDRRHKSRDNSLSRTNHDRSVTSRDRSRTSRDRLRTSLDRSRAQQKAERGRNSLDRRHKSRDNSISQTSHDQSKTSRDRSRTSRDRSRTSRDRLRTSRDLLRTSRDRLRISRERSRTSRDHLRTSLDRSRARSSRERSRERFLDPRERDRRELQNRYDRRDDREPGNGGRNARMDILKQNSPDRRYRPLSPRDRRDDRDLSSVIRKDSLRSHERGPNRESDFRENYHKLDVRDNHNIRESSREREQAERYSKFESNSGDLRDELNHRAIVKGGNSRSREQDRHYFDSKITSYERGDRRNLDWDYPDRRRERDFFESEDRLHQIQLEIEKKQKWEAYRKDLLETEEEVTKSYKIYQAQPERHPMYPGEWKSFWNRRYKEIQMTGQDPNLYDYKPEWILFWQKKMKELFKEDLASKKEEVIIRHKIDPSEEPYSLDLQDVSPPTPERPKDVTVQDIQRTWNELTGSKITTVEPAPEDKKCSSSPFEEPSHGTKRSLSPTEDRGRRIPPWERNKYTNQQQEQQNAPSTYHNNNNNRDHRDRDSHFQAPVSSVVHCLRLLSVLEQQLGILGPRVLDLLTQALALERSRSSGSMMLLDNKDIFLFFETIMEKLRGQLMAGIVMKHLVPTTNGVINEINRMLTDRPLKPEAFEPVTLPGVGAVDKVAVAQKIAASLVAMGRTNVSQEELEQLISAVIGMASTDNISADISTDKFFSQLNMKNSNASSHINTILQSMISSAQQSVQSAEPQSTQPVQLMQPLQAVEPQSSQLKQPIESVHSVLNNEPSLMPTKDIRSVPKPVMNPKPADILIPGVGRKGVGKRAPSPFSLRADTGANPIGPEMSTIQNIYDVDEEDDVDEDEEDYSFEEVFHAAEKKVKQTELEKRKDSVDSAEAENSQTQSGFSAIPAESMKAVNDMLKSLSAINAAPPVELSVPQTEPPKEDPTNQMLANIASLSRPLSLPEDPPITKHFDDTSSLVASIKNSLVESFSKDNSTTSSSIYSTESLSTRVDPPPSRESRRVLDPRSREQWDPSLRDLSKQDPYAGGGKEWSGDRWGSGYGHSEKYTERPNTTYDSRQAYRFPESSYRPTPYRDDYGEAPMRESPYGPRSIDYDESPIRESPCGPRSMNYDDSHSGFRHSSISRPYEPGPPREQSYHQMRGPSSIFNVRGRRGLP